MRPAALLTILVLGPTVAAAADKIPAKSPDIRYAIQDRVEVRCQAGENEKFYVTNVLKRGTRVEVVGDAGNGWLKINPPFGSYSWINQGLTKPAPGPGNHYAISGATSPVPVFPGTEVADTLPGGLRSVELQDGTLVTATGKIKTSDGVPYMAIEPPPGEFRYVKSDLVSRTRPPDTFVKVSDATQKQTSAKPPGEITPASVAVPASVTSLTIEQADELWRKAQQAVAAQNFPEAARLYRQAADGREKADPGWARKARAYADWLDQEYARRRTGAVAPAPVKGAAVSIPNYTGPAGANRTTAAPASRLASAPTVRLSSPLASTAEIPPRWKGRLRRSGRLVDLQQTYVLENDAGNPITYVMAQPGVSLESWLGKEVELFGQVNYRGDLRALLMTAVQARQP